jgi:hypothetical protein
MNVPDGGDVVRDSPFLPKNNGIVSVTLSMSGRVLRLKIAEANNKGVLRKEMTGGLQEWERLWPTVVAEPGAKDKLQYIVILLEVIKIIRTEPKTAVKARHLISFGW